MKNKNLLSIFLFLIFSWASLQPVQANDNEPAAPNAPMSGNYDVGVGRAYTTITAAVAAIAANGVSGNVNLRLADASYLSETFPIVLNDFEGASAGAKVTIRPKNNINAVISGSTNGSLLYFNGSSYWVIDGRNTNGASLTLDNSSTGAYAKTISYYNGSTYNTITNCTIKGSARNTASGIILFSNTNDAPGNSYNTISECNITQSTAVTPRHAIYCTSSAATQLNTGNEILNNNIYNFFDPFSDSYGVFMGARATEWVISGNSFYNTSAKVFTSASADWNAIVLDNTATGENTVISGNYIGGSAPNCAGSKLSFSGNGVFKGIVLAGRGGTGIKNVVSNNYISNISNSTSSTDINALIYHRDGNADILNNNLGSQTILSDIQIFGTSTGALVSGLWRTANISCIFAGGAIGEPVNASGTVLIDGNILGGIEALRSGIGDAQLRGIDAENNFCVFTITNNTVGSALANNMRANSNGSTLGIFVTAGSLVSPHVLDSNTVRNFSNDFAGLYATTTGIRTQGSPFGNYTITNNSVSNISSASLNLGFLGTYGIAAAAVSNHQIVAGNTVQNIIHTGTTSASAVGIIYSGPTLGSHTMERNRVTNVSSVNQNGGLAYGLDARVAGGLLTVANNMVVLGYDASGNNMSTSNFLTGMYESTTAGAIDVYYNSIHVGGNTTVSTGQSTRAFRSNSPAGLPRNIKNNIFVNNRASNSGVNTAYYITNLLGETSAGNILYANPANGAGSVMALINGNPVTSVGDLYALTNQNRYSVSAPQTFLNPASDLRLVASPSDVNFQLSNEGEPIAGITTDYYGTARNAYTPDPGFHEYLCRGCWVGKNSKVWEVSGNGGAGGNWEDGFVPSNLIHAKVMNAPYQPIINTTSGVAATADLSLKTPALITLDNLAGGKLQVNGNITNRDGKIDGIQGVFEMSGTLAQNIPANLFVNDDLSDLSIANTDAGAGVSLGGPLDIFRAVTFTAAGNRLNTNDHLTLKSNTNATAYIGNLTGKTFIGKTTVERYLPAIKAWRFVATPFMSSTSPTLRESWQEGGNNSSTGYGTEITGNSAVSVGLDLATPFPSMKSYNAVTNNYDAFTNAFDKIANNKGYMLFVRGDRSVSVGGVTGATTLRIKGDILQGAQAINVLGNKFESVGNPYASQVDFRNVNKAAVADQFVVWNPASPGKYGYGAYETYVRMGANYVSVPGAVIKNYIESGQAIFVQNNIATTGTLTFQEASKSTGSNVVSRETAEIPEQGMFIDLNVRLQNGDDLLTDGAYLGFSRNYSKSIDNDDVLKFKNTYDNLNIFNDNKKLLVDRRPVVTANDTVFLHLAETRVATYHFVAKPNNLNTPGLTAYLVDQFTNVKTNLSLVNDTKIDFNITNAAASKAANRFYIVFNQAARPAMEFVSTDLQRNGTKLKLNFTTQHEYEIQNYEIEKSVDSVNFLPRINMAAKQELHGAGQYEFIEDAPYAKSNYYRVKGITYNGSIIYSKIVGLRDTPELPTGSSLVIYPNPVTDGVINLNFQVSEQGNYQIHVINNLGQIVLNITNNFGLGNNSKKIFTNLAAGKYNLQLIKDGSIVDYQSFIVVR